MKKAITKHTPPKKTAKKPLFVTKKQKREEAERAAQKARAIDKQKHPEQYIEYEDIPKQLRDKLDKIVQQKIHKYLVDHIGKRINEERYYFPRALAEKIASKELVKALPFLENETTIENVTYKIITNKKPRVTYDRDLDAYEKNNSRMERLFGYAPMEWKKVTKKCDLIEYGDNFIEYLGPARIDFAYVD